MKEIMGGLFMGGLLGWVLFGLVPGLILIILGAAVAAGELAKEKLQEREAASWRKNYPSYKYLSKGTK